MLRLGNATNLLTGLHTIDLLWGGRPARYGFAVIRGNVVDGPAL